MIRIATLDDLDSVTWLVTRMAMTAPYIDDVDPNVIRENIRYLLTGPRNERIILLSEIDGVPTGTLGASVSRSVFSAHYVASELFWWVEPEYRNSREGLLLKEGFEQWAIRVGAKTAALCHMANEYADRLDKHFRKKGYIPVEHTYIKELQ